MRAATPRRRSRRRRRRSATPPPPRPPKPPPQQQKRLPRSDPTLSQRERVVAQRPGEGLQSRQHGPDPAGAVTPHQSAPQTASPSGRSNARSERLDWMKKSRILVGIFGAPHGVRGEVRLKSFTGDPMAIADYPRLTDETGARPFKIIAARPVKDDMLIVRVD